MMEGLKNKAAFVTGGRSAIGRAAALVAALAVLYAGAVRSMLYRNLKRLRAGDVEPLFNIYAEDVQLVLHGQHSWSGHYRGKDEVERWMRRFVRIGVQLEPREMFVAGPPWNTTVWMRFTDQLTAPDGTIVYANRGTIFGKIAWGKLTYHEVNEDTQKVVELDEYLEAHEKAGREEQEERKEGKVQELNYELLRQGREQLLREAERGRLVRELRAAQRRVSSSPSGRPGGSIGRIAGRILVVLRVPREKARC